MFGGKIDQARFEDQYSLRTDLKLHPFPDFETFESYKKNDFNMRVSSIGMLQKRRMDTIEPRLFHCFFDQSWWDKKETDSFRFKKMWLKPYYETPVRWSEYLKYSTGYETKPELPRKKRRRLDDAALKERRTRLAQKQWKQAMKRPDRWRRCNEASHEAKEVFFDREQTRLSEFWAGCTKHVDERVFLS